MHAQVVWTLDRDRTYNSWGLLDRLIWTSEGFTSDEWVL
jgi:hypothetical protein